jgi:hypothetical protein
MGAVPTSRAPRALRGDELRAALRKLRAPQADDAASCRSAAAPMVADPPPARAEALPSYVDETPGSAGPPALRPDQLERWLRKRSA